MAGLRERLARWIAPAAETRAIYAPAGWGPNVAATRVNAIVAENLSMVTACINAIASGLASLPAFVYRTQGEGRTEVPSHPVARMLRQPNPRMTWPEFVEWLMGSVLLHGNAVAAIELDGAGRPVSLQPIPWPSLSPVMLPSGKLAFDVVAGNGTQTRRYLAEECLFLKDRSDDGWLGRSRIGRAPDVLGAAIGLQTYSTAIWSNAATPSGMLELPAGIDKDGLRRLSEHFDQVHAGAANGGKVLFVDRDTRFTALSISPEQAEVLSSRRFSGEEIARLFGVPPPIVGDLSHGTFTNSETAGRWFAQFTLAPWAKRIEAAFQRDVFADPSGATHMEIDLSGLMRGSYVERWQAQTAAVQAGILTPDEVREQEGFNPLPKTAAASQPANGLNA